jgi:hypothetical protein
MDNLALASSGLCAGTHLDRSALPASGTYTILVDPYATTTGTVTFTVVPEVRGTITVDGPDVTLTTTTAGQNASVTFSGSAGQRVALYAPSSTFTSAVPVTIYKPAADGSASTTNGSIYGGSWNTGSTTGVLTLPSTGIYTVLLNPPSINIGAMTFRLTSQ